ncbi:tRNA lysidine(34) synthetase TilS [Utexia brackfieldae]|uniref:tRNA lysidine(34) synthetase TilS n=1 Tax=Utexia brackfieldae TaxID=3074108 RepID=UPI00370DAE68
MTDSDNPQSIFKAIKPYLNQAPAILVAFSGGIDSTVLLHALVTLRTQYGLKLRAIYIHHGLSIHADKWAAHCETVCKQWDVPLHITKVNIQQNGNIEAQARQARYQAIKQALLVNEVVMAAQHQDDQSETFLLALKRGSGPTGLSAMPDISNFATTSLIRPLLTISRSQIEDYANHFGLIWIEDESNQDDRYDRNFLRLQIIPKFKQRWPYFHQMVSRCAAICAEETALIAELLHDEIANCIDHHHNLNIAPLLTMSDIKRNAILRAWFKHHHVEMPARQQLNLIWHTVALAKEDANPQFVINDYTIRRYQAQLYLVPQHMQLINETIEWDLATPLLLPDHLGRLTIDKISRGNLRLPNKNEKVTVRFQAQGRLNIVGRQGSRPIKKIWQELGIAPWMRQRIPIIYYNEQIITAVGVFVTQEGQGNQIEISHNHYISCKIST